jgi:hypothetical protein
MDGRRLLMAMGILGGVAGPRKRDEKRIANNGIIV